MVSFESDYVAGAHPRILERLLETNLEPQSGYGLDGFSESARDKIRSACGCPDAQVEFLTGGTQANAVVISTMLREYEGVIAAESGHIHTHEAGAVEYGGHKILTLPQHSGKVSAEEFHNLLLDFYEDENREHMVFPGMLYISHPTEYGAIYSLAELETLAALCRTFNILLYLDGARLGCGLMSPKSDVSLRDIAQLCDVFYIGGTKMGALCGEAVVFPKGNRPDHFINSLKRRGALLAKGRLLGIQFDTLFTGGLYEEIGRHTVQMAQKMADIFQKYQIPFYLQSPTNQQFVILENRQMAFLREQIAFSFWEKYDEAHTVVRFAAGWSTSEEDLLALDAALGKYVDNSLEAQYNKN